MTDATPKPAEVTITITLDGKTETFTASAVTDGDPANASNWTHDVAEESRKLARAVRW